MVAALPPILLRLPEDQIAEIRAYVDAQVGRALADRVEHRDQVLTEAAELTRAAAEALPDGHQAIPGLLVATSGLLAARTTTAQEQPR